MTIYNKQTRKQWQNKLQALQSQRHSAAEPLSKKKTWQKNLQSLQTQRFTPSASAPGPDPASRLLAPNFSFGVQFQAPWSMWGNGICEAWRRYARALALTGTPVHLVLDALYGKADPRVLQEVRDLLTPKKSNIFVGGFPTAGDDVQSAVINKLINDKNVPVILTTLLERDRIGPQSVAQANRAAQWWLPCEATADVFRSSGVAREKLRVVHIPFFPDDPHLSLVGRPREPGPPHFYRIGIIDPRKDQLKTLIAFMRAFKPGEARLTLKTYAVVQNLHAWRFDPDACANGWTNENFGSWIRIINAMWGQDELVDLHRQGDIYLSLSHGEGWDMPAYDAMLSGNRMIYTASGGPQEFASERDLLVPTSGMVPCDPYYKWERDAHWIDYDVDAAALQMRKAAAELYQVKTHGRSWEKFTSGYVGKQMLELLIGIVDPGVRQVPEAARAALYRWTGDMADPKVQALSRTYLPRELYAATGMGPVSADDAIEAGRSEVAFVYQPKSIPCGVASHTMSLAKAHPRASWMTSVDEAAKIPDLKALVLEVPLGGINERVTITLAQLRKRGVRIVLDEHHAETVGPWFRGFRLRAAHADRVIFYNPFAPQMIGCGIYVPLPVPKLVVSEKAAIGGLVFVGFADPSRRIDALVGVAERLKVPIYGYGPHLGQIPGWYDTRAWSMYRPVRSYLDENEGASEIARHKIALFARTANCPAYASASARFCMAAGIPVLVDHSQTYMDVASHVAGVVDYDDHAAVDDAVRRLLEDDGIRAAALKRQNEYRAAHPPQSVLSAMGLL